MRKAGHQLLLIRTAICSSAFTHQLQFNTRVLRPRSPLPAQYLHRHQSSTTTSLDCNNNNNEVISIMPNGVKKENLPTKVCVVCGRPYTWRKKWEKVWDEVTTCSKSCNRKRKEKNRQSNRSATIPDESASTNQDFVTDTQYTDASSDDNNRVDMLSDDILALQIAEDTETLLSYEEDNQSTSSDQRVDTILDAKQQRKLEKKRKRAERRAQREGRGDPSAGQKQCTICNKSVNLLIRCQYDKSAQWGMVCGACWNDVSGGVVDGDKDHPYYRYGGLWKNRRAQT